MKIKIQVEECAANTWQKNNAEMSTLSIFRCFMILQFKNCFVFQILMSATGAQVVNLFHDVLKSFLWEKEYNCVVRYIDCCMTNPILLTAPAI